MADDAPTAQVPPLSTELEQEPEKRETVGPETKPAATPAEDFEEEESDATSTYSGRGSHNRRESASSLLRHHLHSRTASEDTADNSSHNGDDVFSEHGSRSHSSVGSVDGGNDSDSKTPQGKDSQSRRESYASSRNSENRNSDRVVSGVSTRSTHSSFRTPSEVRALQMDSPTPSVFDGSSARSNKRHSGTSAIFPTVSRVGSPTVQVQYSPKGRTTPSRFKVRTEAPLVLLHVTLLPLRWVWGETLNGLDLVNGKAIDEGGLPYEASEEMKTLRDSWRELQDRLGDTVLERGILLPHPQNDFEVLEERLLEALELPFKRRARILECGHYLGPANVTADDEEESETGYSRSSEENRHWCKQCKTEIRYERLGSSKIYRVKVYASNGLMKSGAWEACWREMERVDCEVELILSPAMQHELEKVAVFQLEQEEQRQRDLLLDAEAAAKSGLAPEPQADAQQSRPASALHGSRPSSGLHVEVHPSTPEPPMEPFDRVTSPEFLQPPSSSRPRSGQDAVDTSEERRLRDEERMREIYGDMPPPEPVPTPEPTTERTPFARPASSVDEGYGSVPLSQALVAITPTSSLDQSSTLRDRHPDSYIAPPTPLSPSEVIRERRAEYERRQAERAQKRQRELQNAGFIDLLTEAFRVALDNGHETVKDCLTYVKAGALVARDFFNDPKNVAIVVLVLLVVVIGLGNRQQDLAPTMYKPEPRTENYVAEKAPEAKIETSVPETTAGLASTEAAAMGLGGVVYGASSDPAVQPQTAVVEETPAAEVEVEAVAPVIRSIEAAVDKVTTEVESIVETVKDVPVSAEVVEGIVSEVQATEVTEASVELVLASASKVEVQPAQGEVTVLKVAEKSESGVELYGSVPRKSEEEETPAPGVENERGVEIFGAEQRKAEAEENGLEQVIVGKKADTEESGAEQVVVGRKAEPGEYALEQVVVGKRHSTVIDFIPGPFVTQHKTVRVFETVTEIVRVSVVTKTQTVSRVVTAIPQTVEQTVYETETVKITVSLPVEKERKTETKKPSPTRRRFW
ncbi:hypothetical protein QBC36DRAFT_26141 [Triangularia setosa]|uniref:Pathway-specific nitrogen regulator n=1 Tax=Triangularia setosa TaxID=2587417 RepID=A0AAN7A7K3_9PEZI|nr:hypothetical protein QBC36DRAFT_26141 [Podospora setosa]